MNIYKKLEENFKLISDKKKAIKQKSYLKNKFEFYGISSPERKKIQKKIFKENIINDENLIIKEIQNLWKSEYREMHYAACDFAIYNFKKFSNKIFDIFEYMIKNNSWWDTVDTISSNLIGKFILKNKEYLEIMDKWILNENIWVSRAAIIFQLKWKNNTDEKRLFNYCLLKANEKEFFIKKAIGWSLREYSKTNNCAVKNFIKENNKKLSFLSIKEGSKYLK